MHQVVFLLYPGVAPFDVAGPAQAFARAGADRYAVAAVSIAGGLIDTDVPGIRLDSRPAAAIERADTLMLPGGDGTQAAVDDTRLIGEVRRLSGRAGRIATVCVGAFLAAEAGLLAGRRAATHWAACDALARRYPDVRVEADPIWLRDGPVWSSAGISAGVDLALAMIEADLGLPVALRVAKELVVYLKRPGGQSQFSSALSRQIQSAGEPLASLLAWIADHLAEDLRADRLAARVTMSPRTFARAFGAATGSTPAKVVEGLRVEAARQLIEETSVPLPRIAAQCGFGDVQRLRRAFRRSLGTLPSDLRERFGQRPAGS